MDCQHWIPFMLETERDERKRLEREVRQLKKTLAYIHDLTHSVERPKPDYWELAIRGQRAQSLIYDQQQALRGQQSAYGGLLGGFNWPW